MATEPDALATTLLLLGSGAAGYAAGRWLVNPWLDAHPARDVTTVPAASPSSTAPQPNARPPATRPARAQSVGPIAAPAPTPIDPYSPSPAPIRYPTSDSTPVGSSPVSGPITSPAQLDAIAPQSGPPPSAAPIDPYASSAPSATASAPSVLVGPPIRAVSMSPRVRHFDRAYNRYRGEIPLEYIRALVDRESNGNPQVQTGSAIGLMQIVPVVLTDYNKRHGATYTSEQLTDPAINVAIGCELLRIIINGYRRYHPRVPNLQANWDNPRFVELLTFGWNAGFSEAGGVGRVVTYLERLGATDITLDLVHDHARVAGASKYLSSDAKVAWCKSVVALYLHERSMARASLPLAA